MIEPGGSSHSHTFREGNTAQRGEEKERGDVEPNDE